MQLRRGDKMSFSSEVKEELVRHVPSSRHCRIAELTALLMTSDSVLKPWIRLRTENLRVAKKFSILIYRIFSVACQVRIRIYPERKTVYELVITDTEACRNILMACKLQDSSDLDHLIIQKDCCKRAFLRGTFLTSGSVNNPEKSYHFEISCEQEDLAKDIQEIMGFFDLDGKIVLRKKNYVVYLKEGSMIVDALNVMEAHLSLMNMENVRVLKDVRNRTNRRVNCDLANINKTVTAARKQLEDIRYIEQKKGFRDLNEGLRQVAELRLQEPEISLKELGEMLQPPVSKSGVNHRLRKLSEIADALRNEE